MVRLWFALALAACCGPVVPAQDPPQKKQPAQPEITLKVGDPAPKLKVTKWVKGSPVQAFEPGKVYVVEFWATWCGPCIAAMPHISDLQEEFRDKGLTVIGLTSRDPNNSEKQVEDFVKGRGESIMRYTVAWCQDRSTNDDYMKAAGRNGIPCSFVVDQQGKVAFIGHPLILDEVLPNVIEGKWNGKTDAEAAEKTLNEFFDMLQQANRDPAAGLAKFTAFEQKAPRLANQFRDQKLMLLMRGKKMDEAEALFGEVMAAAVKKKDAMKLTSIGRMWSTPQFNPEKRNLKLAVEAIESAQQIAGTNDIGTLLTSAQVYDAAGDKAKAAEFADKAVAAAPDNLKERVKSMVERYKK